MSISNEERVEEILIEAYRLGIVDDLFKAVEQLVETGGFDKITAYENAFQFLTSKAP